MEKNPSYKLARELRLRYIADDIVKGMSKRKICEKYSEEWQINKTTVADYYREASFTHFVTKSPDMKQVVNTNKAIVYVEKHEDQLLMISCIDNLLKGAVGQAVQNMNIMFGLDEKSGLKLKASAF